jgi:hypothetical protein
MQGVITGLIVGLAVMAVEHKVYDRGWTSRSASSIQPGITIQMPDRETAFTFDGEADNAAEPETAARLSNEARQLLEP